MYLDPLRTTFPKMLISPDRGHAGDPWAVRPLLLPNALYLLTTPQRLMAPVLFLFFLLISGDTSWLLRLMALIFLMSTQAIKNKEVGRVVLQWTGTDGVRGAATARRTPTARRWQDTLYYWALWVVRGWMDGKLHLLTASPQVRFDDHCCCIWV